MEGGRGERGKAKVCKLLILHKANKCRSVRFMFASKLLKGKGREKEVVWVRGMVTSAPRG